MKTRTIFAAVTLSVAALSPAQAEGGLADLIVANVSASATQALADQQIAVDCDVVNVGVGPAGLSRLKYYFSADSVYDAGDQYLNYDAVAALSATTAGSETANVRVPAGTPDGSYYVLIVADFDQEVAESSETNNVYPLAITVGAPALGPDYAVELASASSGQAYPDEVVAVSANVLNLGAASTSETRLKYYLSLDESYDPGDPYLNYDAVAPLGAQGASPEEANLRVPVGTADGHYFILFVADQTEVVTESDESNNVAALPLTVGDLVARPDITLSSLTASTALVRAGESVSVSALVENLGNAPAPDVYLKYILSTDVVFDVSDKQLSYDKVDALSVGQVSAEDASLNISTATVAGDYFLLFVADADDEAVEHDESDNVVAIPIEVTRDNPTASLADLTITSAALDATHAPPGGSLAVTLSLENVGVIGAGASRVNYYFSANASYEPGDTYLNYDPVEALSVSATSPETANLTVPSSAALGAGFVLAVVDAADDVAERYESDNVLALSFTVGSSTTSGPGDDPNGTKADLVVDDAWVASIEVDAGERAHLFTDVLNEGVAAATASQLKYYLSRDDSYDDGDKYLGLDGVDAVAVGAVSAEDVQPLIPETTEHGSWHLLIVVDAKDEVAEQYESNNVSAVAIEVIVDDPSLDAADLVAHTPATGKAIVGAGYELAVEVVVENQGTQPAPSSRLKYFLSDDEIRDDLDSYLDYRTLDEVAIGEIFALSAELRIPAAATNGPKFVLVVVDSGRDVVESYESNNLLAIPIAVGADSGPNAAYPYVCPSSLFVDPSLVGHKTVATLNALHLGWENAKDMVAMACVVSHFDLVGLVEIDTPQGLVDLEHALESLTGEAWSSHLSEYAVGNANGTEYYGYVWRSAEVVMTGSLGFFDDPNDDIKREPYGANFAMGNFDFTLVVFHLQYGSSISTRRAEAEHLIDVYDYFQAQNGPETDLLIGGDFNLPANDAAFTVLELRDTASITDPEQKTSFGLFGMANSFDHIFYAPANTQELLASGALDFTQNNYSLLRDTVSDHLPVWMSFDTSTDDD